MVKQTFKKIFRLWNGLVSSLGLVGGLLIVVISALSTWNIISRYIFKAPIVWADEICEYLLLISVFLTLPVSWREDQHVRVDVLYNRWKIKWRNRANLLFSFWAFLFCASLTWYGFLQARYAMVQGETSITATGIATYPVLAFIPIGSFLLCLQIAVSTRRPAKGKDGQDLSNRPGNDAGQREREGE